MTDTIPEADRIDLFRRMVLIRRCEEQLARAHQKGLVHGACHTYVGQEAIAAGVCAHLRTEDVVFSTHRGHGHALAKGVPAVSLMAELYGRAAVPLGGNDVTVVALARMVGKALEAAEQLSAEGISVEVIDPRTVAPLDVETIGASVAKTGRLVIADEAFAPYGFGAEVAAAVSDRYFNELDAPIRRVNGAHSPTPYSPPLEAAVVPTTDDIARTVRDLLAE